MSAYRDAQANNDITRNARQYTDLDLNFTRKNSNSDVNILTDVQAVKRSLRNLILLNYYEKPFHPEIAGGVRQMLFENMTPTVSIIIAKQIEQVIANYEPRARLVSIRAIPNYDKNSYEVNIEFYIVNTPTELVDMSVMLERLR
jgi:phage baseplate assembly protein W